jgi:O-antigen/teichoic acid export membrane protein
MDQPISVLSRVFLVTFAGGYYNDFEQYKQVTSINLLMFSALGFGLALAASPLTPIFFTSAFTLTPALVIILTATSIFNSVEVINSSLTIALDYPQANRNAKIVTLVFYLPLAFFLTARYQVFGAAWSNVAAWGIYAFIHAMYMRRRLPKHGAYALRTMALGTGLYIGVIVVYWITRSPWMMLAAVPAYFILGHFLKLWNLVSLPAMLYRLLPQKQKARSI